MYFLDLKSWLYSILRMSAVQKPLPTYLQSNPRLELSDISVQITLQLALPPSLPLARSEFYSACSGWPFCCGMDKWEQKVGGLRTEEVPRSWFSPMKQNCSPLALELAEWPRPCCSNRSRPHLSPLHGLQEFWVSSSSTVALGYCPSRPFCLFYWLILFHVEKENTENYLTLSASSSVFTGFYSCKMEDLQ